MTTLSTDQLQENTLLKQLFIKDYLVELTDYINWADDIVIGWLAQITDEQWNRSASSSFGSIKETAVHIAGAKKIWIDFWKNDPEPVYLSKVFTGSRTELITIWKKASADLKDFIDNFPVEKYMDLVKIMKPNAELSMMEFRKTVPHMVNHSTYHRGQLVTLLRQAGFYGFSNTDLFTFYSLTADKG